MGFAFVAPRDRLVKAHSSIHLEHVQAVYSGAEGRLWQLLMGEQIHVGGWRSSMDLAGRAELTAGMRGVDLCCCLGAGMRFLLRYRGATHMTGVDATARMIEKARRRCMEEGLGDRTSLLLADACTAGLPDGSFDFVWGEDAWCYVEDKPTLIAEAARMVAPGGKIAFTDWIESGPGLSDVEAERFLSFMKFPNLEDLPGYSRLLASNGCRVVAAEDTGRFAPHVDLYLGMLEMQVTGDALAILGFDAALFEAVVAEMRFIQGLAHAGKITQALFVARKEARRRNP